MSLPYSKLGKNQDPQKKKINHQLNTIAEGKEGQTTDHANSRTKLQERIEVQILTKKTSTDQGHDCRKPVVRDP